MCRIRDHYLLYDLENELKEENMTTWCDWRNLSSHEYDHGKNTRTIISSFALRIGVVPLSFWCKLGETRTKRVDYYHESENDSPEENVLKQKIKCWDFGKRKYEIVMKNFICPFLQRSIIVSSFWKSEN